MNCLMCFFFFFQAEDGIRDLTVTGVQTCALPILLSMLPLLFLATGLPGLGALRELLLEHDLFALSPFAWGVRAAVLAGRGDLPGFGVYAVLALGGLMAGMGVAAVLVRRIHRGELDLGGTPAGAGVRPARMVLPGTIGALLEKDLKVAWRDPALKATVLIGLLGPLLFLFFMYQARGPRGFGASLIMVAAFVGVSGFGGNAFGLERRGIAL